MARYIDAEANKFKYYVVRNKATGQYFRGKGENKWGKYYNQASIYRFKKHAENAVEEETRRGNPSEVVEIRITDTADVVEVKHGEWTSIGLRNPHCSLCHKYNYEESRFCPNCGTKMDLEEGAQ